MEYEVVVRAATAADMEERATLVRRGITDHDVDAFFTFFFQELTLQVCVLGGAVLFIFFGTSVFASALVVPGVAVLLALAVAVAHRAHADTHVQRTRNELYGFVAECRGPLTPGPGAARVRVRVAGEGGAAREGGRLVGTASVCECWGPRRAGWLHALSVSAAWRRRGVGGALEAACRAAAAARGLHALQTATSQLQGGACALLHAAGWQVRATYHRRLLGAALTLPMTQLAIELPFA